MIGSPALRGAVSSLACAGRGCAAATSGLNAVSATIAARVTMAGGPQRRVATSDCTVVNRLIMPCPVEMRVRVCVDRRSNCELWITNNRHHLRRNSLLETIRFASGNYRHVSMAVLSYTTARAGGRVARG